jgi:hypothetical protein
MPERNPARASRERYDLVIGGGGILGAMVLLADNRMQTTDMQTTDSHLVLTIYMIWADCAY